MGAILVLLVVVAVVGLLAAVALGLLGGAKKTVDAARRDDRPSPKSAEPGFFG